MQRRSSETGDNQMLTKITPIAILSLFLSSLLSAPFVVAALASDPSAANSQRATKPNLNELRAKAEAGDVNAEYQLIEMFFQGDGVPQDYTEAFKWSLKAAKQGISAAQYGVGLMYYYGKGVPADKAEAAKWFRKAAEQNDARSEDWLGTMYSNGDGVEIDKSEALKWFRKAANQGDAIGQLQIGMRYAVGDGFTKDYNVAIKWLRKAANQGNAMGELWLGRMYNSGHGVPKDSTEAVKWFRKAADQGEAYARYQLGLSDYVGDGVPKNPSEAFRWTQKAAAQGLVSAERQLGYFYGGGFGIPEDQAEAIRWSARAAKQGDTQAQTFLALSYIEGDGVPKDEIEGLAWLNLAAAWGDQYATKYRTRLENALGPTARLAALERSKELIKEIDAAKAASDGNGSSLENPDLTNQTPKAYGSGAIVSAQGNILTAAHVVTGATQLVVVTTKGRCIAIVLQIDEANDIAVLKIDGGPYMPLPVAQSNGVRLGQAVSTIGFPNVEIQGFSPKVTRGEISSIDGIADDPRGWQISVPVQPGNSGGPLLDENGNIIGIVEAKLGLKAAEATGDIPQNVNYAVKSAYALALLAPYLDSSAAEPNHLSPKQNFEDMISNAQQSVVLILVY
jgi:TPR repeat protein